MTLYYFNPETNDVSELQGIREKYPSASIPDNGDVTVLGYFPINETEVPVHDKLTQTLVWSVESRGSAKGQEFFRKYIIADLPRQDVQKNLKAMHTEKEKQFSELTQKMLDDFAKERGYDSIASAVGYANSSVPNFKSEASQCILLRDKVWTEFYSLMQKVQTGKVQMPSDFSDVQKNYPDFVWK